MTDHRSPEELVAESDRLDEMFRTGDWSGLVDYVEDVRVLSVKTNRLVRAMSIVAVVAIAIGIGGFFYARDVRENAQALAKTQDLIRVYCEQTNVFNAQARDKFVTLFQPGPNDALIAQIADAAWPQRDCVTGQ